MQHWLVTAGHLTSSAQRWASAPQDGAGPAGRSPRKGGAAPCISTPSIQQSQMLSVPAPLASANPPHPPTNLPTSTQFYYQRVYSGYKHNKDNGAPRWCVWVTLTRRLSPRARSSHLVIHTPPPRTGPQFFNRQRLSTDAQCSTAAQRLSACPRLIFHCTYTKGPSP